MNHSPYKTKAGTMLHISDLRGKAYLEVKYRVQWFREEHPEWAIQTSFPRLDDDITICKAEVLDEQGRLRSTSHKREDAKHFADHMEKAETGAIGRALALLGYGTQFTGDELEEGDRIVDSPISKQIKPKINDDLFEEILGPSDGPIHISDAMPLMTYRQTPIRANPNKNVSESQIKRLWAICKAKKWSTGDAFTMASEAFGITENFSELKNAQYEKLIHWVETMAFNECMTKLTEYRNKQEQ